MLIEIVKFIFYSLLIVIISKYILVETIRKLAETLRLSPKAVGDVAGYATSMPELLTITTSSIRGLNGVSIYNIFSSNVINLVQYLSAVIFNRNIKKLKNVAIITDIIMVIFTIIIPILFLKLNISLNISIVPLFIFLYIGCRLLNNNAHRIYLVEEKENLKKSEKSVNKSKRAFIYFILLLFTGFVLFLVSELLGDTLENLCIALGISEVFIGILLGIITSIPELITFFESQKFHKNSKDEMHGIVEATNNLLTSNILNLFVIQTIGIIISKT